MAAFVEKRTPAVPGPMTGETAVDSARRRRLRNRLLNSSPIETENLMANSPSSKKRALQAERRADMNKARRSRMRTFIRKVEEALASGDAAAAEAALRDAQPEIMRSVSKGVLHKNTASRKISRLAGRVNALARLTPRRAATPFPLTRCRR